MSKRDIELLMDEISQDVIAAFPSKIAAINTEKGDSLLSFNSDAYFLHYLPTPDVLPAYPVSFLQYLPSDIRTRGIEGQTLQTVTVSIDAVINHTNIGTDTDARIALRYQRAIQEIVESELRAQYAVVTSLSPLLTGEDFNGDTVTIAQVQFQVQYI